MMPVRGEWWRLSLGTLAFVVLAFYTRGLFALSLAALLWAAGPTRWWERSLIALLVLLGLAFVIPPDFAPLDAAVGAYTVLAAAAFAGGALIAQPGGALRQAVRAALWGVAGTGTLGLLLRGRVFWNELHWSTVRVMTAMISLGVEGRPQLAEFSASIVRFLADAFPALLLLSTLAALLLAWQWHVHISSRPLGAPLGKFREFRFGDQWVWGLVLTFVIWAVPRLTALKWVAVNVAIVLGALYVVRGTAVLVAIGDALGMPTKLLSILTVFVGGVLVGLAVVFPGLAEVLVLPFFVLVPGLWTLGVFDTWLAFRQRRFSRSPVP